MSTSHTTTDHKTIQTWAEARGGRPSVVHGTESKDGNAILRLDFREKDDKLDETDWGHFFKTFDERALAFLYQDKTADGHESRFFKFVHREGADAA